MSLDDLWAAYQAAEDAAHAAWSALHNNAPSLALGVALDTLAEQVKAINFRRDAELAAWAELHSEFQPLKDAARWARYDYDKSGGSPKRPRPKCQALLAAAEAADAAYEAAVADLPTNGEVWAPFTAEIAAVEIAGLAARDALRAEIAASPEQAAHEAALAARHQALAAFEAAKAKDPAEMARRQAIWEAGAADRRRAEVESDLATYGWRGRMD